jgi:hypothetical protein
MASPTQPSEDLRVAVHEAGHAAAAVLLGGAKPGSVSLHPDAATPWRARRGGGSDAPGRLEDQAPGFWADLIARLAGPAAERRIYGRADPKAAKADERVVVRALRSRGFSSDKAIASLVGFLGRQADKFADEHEELITSAALLLQERDTVPGEDFEAWLWDHQP